MSATDDAAHTTLTPDDAGATGASAPPVERFRMYIGGAWCDAESGRTFETKSPYTGQVWARLPQADARGVDRAVRAAHAAFSTGPWAGMTASDRGLLLHRLADGIAADAERLADLEVRDDGKLRVEMLGQVRYLPRGSNTTAAWPTRWRAASRRSTRRACSTT